MDAEREERLRLHEEKLIVDRTDSVLDEYDGTVSDSLETNRFERNELNDGPMNDRNRF